MRSRKPITSIRKWGNYRSRPDNKKSKPNKLKLGKFTKFLPKNLDLQKSLKIIAGIIVFGFVSLILFVLVVTWDLPSVQLLVDRPPQQSTKILDREGELLYEIHGDEKRTLVALEELPICAEQATLAIEDDNFYNHPGFDIMGIIRAAIYNVLNPSKKQGGSTITQQLVKNSLLTPERTIRRKIRELALALKIESVFTKKEILELYLNQIPYGTNAYGIESAAQTYFGKSSLELSLAECATLAALPKAPTYYSPFGNNVDKLLTRKNIVLNRMEELGMIDIEELANAREQELEFVPKIDKIKAPHFVMWVKDYLVDKYGEDMVEKGGLLVRTTLDSRLQEIAEWAVSEKSDTRAVSYDAQNASLVSINPKNGEVLAMVGSIDYFNKEIDGNVNVALRQRQPGSSFKPFAYAMAFQKGYTPATVVYDTEMDFAVEGYDKAYKPQNYDGEFRGPVSLRQALSNSLNIPALKVLFHAGVRDTIELARRMGITTLKGADQYGLTLVLGGGEVRLLDMTSAYAVFANQGVRHEIKNILSVQDSEGRILEQIDSNDKGKEVLSPDIAYLITNILSDRVARVPVFGAGNWLELRDRESAAKTGTTNSVRDTWTIGYTPSLVAGVWVGNNDNHPMANNAVSSILASPIWNRYMSRALRGTPAEVFEATPDVRFLNISSLSGKLPGSYTPASAIKKEVFLAENIPTETDDYFTIVKVDRLTGALWGENCSDRASDIYIYENIHSVQPEMKNWEKPVQDWASKHRAEIQSALSRGESVPLLEGLPANVKFVNSLGDLPPVYCKKSTDTPRPPKIQIISPTAFSTLAPGQRRIEVQITPGELAIREVEYYLDGRLVGITRDGDYSGVITLPDTTDSRASELDTHRISVRVLDDKYYFAEHSLDVRVQADQIPPEMQIISPAERSEIPLGSQVELSVLASDRQSEMQKVEIYLDSFDEKIAELTASPYKLLFDINKNYTLGEHTLIFRALDIKGNVSKINWTVKFVKAQQASVVPRGTPGLIVSPTADTSLLRNEYYPLVYRLARISSGQQETLLLLKKSGSFAVVLDTLDPSTSEELIYSSIKFDEQGEYELYIQSSFANGQMKESGKRRVVVR